MQKTLRRKKRKQTTRISRQPKKWNFNFKRFFQGLSCLLVVVSLSYVVFWCLQPSNFPISSVRFIGERRHLTPEQLQVVIAPELKKGFFRLKVSTLHRHLLLLPWVKQVEIRRVWPDQLLIHFQEHTPAARWGEKGLLSTTGVLFYPEPFECEELNLPVLQGPEGKSGLVWQEYLIMKETLAPLRLKIARLVLAPRGAWHLQLSNGITVILGKTDVLPRLNRFVHAYEKHIAIRQNEVSYVDLRYTSGMSIGWKAS